MSGGPARSAGTPGVTTDPLDSPRYGLEILASADAPIDPADAIPVFHGFIQTRALPGLLIDVVDYKHVRGGPGVMLIGHECHYAIDLAPPGPKLSVSLRRDVPGNAEARFLWLVTATLRAAAALEADDRLGWRFDRSRLRFRVDDRLVARADEHTYERAAPTLASWATRRFGPLRLERDASSRRPLSTWLHLDAPVVLEAA